jgi:hypothetical protein
MKSNSRYLHPYFRFTAIFTGIEHLVYLSLRILGIGDAG